MEASSSGSFWVTARLCGGLKAAEKDAGKRDRLLRTFLGRYSPSATDLAILVEIITVTAATPPVPRGESLTSAEGIALLCQTLHIDRLEDAPSRRTSVLSLKTVHELCTAARLLGPRAVLSSDAWTTICAEATTADLEVIVHLLCNNRAALVGSLTTADVLAVLSPDSAREFEETNDLVRSVSVLEVGGSPRVLAESHGVFPDEPIDAPPPPLVLPVDVKPVSVIPPASVVKRGAEGTRVRRSCMYGATCTRHNPTHFTEYAHPGDADYHPSDARAPKAAAAVPDVPAPAAALPPVPDEDRSIDGIAPLTLLPSHVFVPVEGVTGTYQVKYCGDGVYTCNCPVWRYQLKGANARTCKHIQQLLGDAYERVRCGMDGVTPMPGVPRTTDAFRGAAPAAAPPASLVGKGMVSLLLANKANHPKTDYTGWWVSEKLDGVRAYWDGARFNSRNGNGFDAPGWFTVHLPKDVTLDGELFGGRKKFQTAVGIVKSSAAHPGWKTLTYEVFDVPSMKSSPFEERMTFLQKTIAAIGDKSPHIHFVLQRKVTGRADIDAEFDKISKLRGEGLMLRQPGSLYVGARSNTLLKVKGTEDVDALVIGYDSGDGKYVGKVGALVVKLANGKQFKVGSGLTDADRSAPPKVGAVVTVRYQELTDGGVPRFPVFVGERADGVWPPVA